MAETQTFAGCSQAASVSLDLANLAEGLHRDLDAVWRGRCTAPVSYPAQGNNACFELEDNSFWFAHRNSCILAVLRRFPTTGPLFDIGGGNGFVAAALQREGGVPVVLVEPGPAGVRHSQTRGLRNVVQATLKEAMFRDGSMPAIGCFDVLEHLDDEQAFLREMRRCLAPGGHLYLTVPAGHWLWSDDDMQAGHFRRYTRASLGGGIGARRLPAAVREQDVFPAAAALVSLAVPAQSFWPAPVARPELFRIAPAQGTSSPRTDMALGRGSPRLREGHPLWHVLFCGG